MKRLLLGGIAVIGKALLGVLALSASAVAAPTGKGDFNHLTTGFPLTGVHAVVVCETCHVGGVFKGTPRNCDGCHALGKRVVATPKSNSHIVTDAPCESCHFNSATFLGARFNHATAQPEQCQICHNGRIAMGKPSGHSSGKKATDSCNHCHRTYAWIPASWNHIGVVPGTCKTCHENSAVVSSENMKPAGHTTVAKSTYQCDDCHSLIGWFPARYKHNTAATCLSCHNGTIAIGKTATHAAPALKGTNPCEDCHNVTGWLPARFKHNTGAACSSCHSTTTGLALPPPTSHNSFIGWPIECNECHLSTVSFSGALGARPANHIPYNTGPKCTNCHTSGIGNAVVTGAALHAYVSSTCKTCHLSGTSYLGNMDKKSTSHEGMGSGDCSQSGCHRPIGNRGTAYIRWD